MLLRIYIQIYRYVYVNIGYHMFSSSMSSVFYYMFNKAINASAQTSSRFWHDDDDDGAVVGRCGSSMSMVAFRVSVSVLVLMLLTEGD